MRLTTTPDTSRFLRRLWPLSLTAAVLSCDAIGSPGGAPSGAAGGSGNLVVLDVSNLVCPGDAVRTIEGACRRSSAGGPAGAEPQCPPNSAWVTLGEAEGELIGGCRCRPGSIANAETETCDACEYGTDISGIEVCTCNGAIVWSAGDFGVPEIDEQFRVTSPCACGDPNQGSGDYLWLPMEHVCLPRKCPSGHTGVCADGCSIYKARDESGLCVLEEGCTTLTPSSVCSTGQRRACTTEDGYAGWETCISCQWQGFCEQDHSYGRATCCTEDECHECFVCCDRDGENCNEC